MKEIKIKLVDIEKLKFEILDNANIGDYFYLNTSISKDSFDSDEIKEMLLVQAKTSSEDKRKKELEIIKKEIQSESEIRILKIQKELEIREQELEFQNKKLKEEKETIIENIQNEKNLEIEKEKNKLQAQYNNQISSLQEEKVKLVSNLEKKDEELKNKIDLINKDTELKIEKKTSELKRKLNEIERREGNIKQIGENLEDWIETKFNEYFGFNDNITIEQPKNINGTKPDFIIRIFDNDKNEIETIVIEAKSESLKSTTKKKNKDHYEKLIKDTINNHGGYSILISELEKGNEFTIFKAEPSNFDNLYVVRPYFFIHLLQVILEITLKDQELKKKEISFKDKNEILKQWEDFKLNLSSSFEKIEKQIETIQKEKTKIVDAATKIENSINIIYNSHISALVNKIEKFNIEKKIVNKVDLIEAKEIKTIG